MKKSKAVCPECGAEGTAGRFCEFCGTKIPVPESEKRDEEPQVEKIIPFTRTAEDVKNDLITTLVRTKYVPTDIFDTFKIVSMERYYCLMYYFNISSTTNWNCTEVIRIEKERYVWKDGKQEKERYYEYEYHPANGTYENAYSILTDGAKYGKEESFGLAKKYNSSYLEDDIRVECLNDNYEDVIDKEGTKINKRGRDGALYQAPSSHQDFRCNTVYSFHHYSVYVAYWKVIYTYKGQTFESYIQGGTEDNDFALPVDEKQKNEHESFEGQKIEVKIGLGYWLLGFLFYGIMPFIIAIFGDLDDYGTPMGLSFLFNLPVLVLCNT